MRLGDAFLKADADQARGDAEVETMAPVPTPEVLWRKPPVLALAALPGTTLGRLGGPSTGSPAAWAAAGAAIRKPHEAPLPGPNGRGQIGPGQAGPGQSRPGRVGSGRARPGRVRPGRVRPGRVGRSFVALAAELDDECEALVRNGILPAGLVTRNRQVAEAALRPWPAAFTHGALRIAHVIVDSDAVTGIIDWSEAGRCDALYDLATFPVGHEEHLGEVLAGHGADVDVIHAWWSLRSLLIVLIVRSLTEHGFDPFAPGCGVGVPRSRM
ncbi:phosphotransferase [Streptomyces sp. 900105755]